MKYILILTFILSLGMFYLAVFQHVSYALFFGIVLLLTDLKFLMDILKGRNDEK